MLQTLQIVAARLKIDAAMAGMEGARHPLYISICVDRMHMAAQLGLYMLELSK